MIGVCFAFISSITLIVLILMTNRYHATFSNDNDLNSVQKYHTTPTSRIGGISIFISFLFIVLFNQSLNVDIMYDANITLSVLMVFIIGILEDLTKRVTPIVRMIIFVLSALVAVYVTHVIPAVTYADFDYLEELIVYYPIIGISLSVFCVVGLTNAYNIIDGYNGLSSTAAVINLLGLIIIARYVQDVNVVRVASVLLATILGFWMFNYPWGKIFLGDSGAYTIGFIIALMSIYLIHEHEGMISPYAVLLIAVYPITEIGFSMYRRKFLHKTKGMHPDAMHLHQLVYRRCTPHIGSFRNSLVMPIMLFFMVPQTILAIMFYKSTLICLSLISIFIVFYVFSYFSIIRFKTFGFLKVLLYISTYLGGINKNYPLSRVVPKNNI